MSCEHPKEAQVIDAHEGSVVCIKCGLVLDKYYPDHIVITNNEEEESTSSIQELGEKGHFSEIVITEANIIFAGLRKSKITPDNHIKAVYCIYAASRNQKVSRTLQEIAILFCVDEKAIYHIDTQLQRTIAPICPTELIERRLCELEDYDHQDIKNIIYLINKLPFDVTQGSSPQSIAAGAVAYYSKIKRKSLNLRKISLLFQVCTRTVSRSMLNIRDYCTYSCAWFPFYHEVDSSSSSLSPYALKRENKKNKNT